MSNYIALHEAAKEAIILHELVTGLRLAHPVVRYKFYSMMMNIGVVATNVRS